MDRGAILVVSASIMMLVSAGSVPAESPALPAQSACAPAPFYAGKAHSIELLRADAQAARQRVRFLVKGAAAMLCRMKVVELDELIERLSSGDSVVAERRMPVREPSRPEFTDERAYAIEFLNAYAEAARNEVRRFSKGHAATLYRMKVVELDELIDRLHSGGAVSYQEVDDAMQRPATFIGGSP
jgi:hypothetical protein